MSQVEFEPTIPAFERAKTVHALDSEATVVGLTTPIWTFSFLHLPLTGRVFLQDRVELLRSFVSWCSKQQQCGAGWDDWTR
jgi:hypothetical protein